MKLIHFSYNDPYSHHPINGFDENLRNIHFIKKGLNPICLVGINGSGKSKLLECIAEVFEYLTGRYTDFLKDPGTTTIQFRIDYIFKLSKGDSYVRFVQNQTKGKPDCFIGKDEDSLVGEKDDSKIRAVLPEIVLGYSSGENESLSQWFHPYVDEYGKYFNDFRKGAVTKKLPDLPHMLWVDFSMNKLVFIANSVFSLDADSKWNNIIKEVNTTALRSFRIIIKLKPKKGPSKGIIAAKEQLDIIETLKRCSSSSHDAKDREQSLVLDYYYSEATYKAFKKNFNSAFGLYTALFKLDTLNLIVIQSELDEVNKIKKETGETLPRPVLIETQKAIGFFGLKMHHKSKSVVQYSNLSDGEHQFLHIFGALNMIQSKNVLFLLDEPETHFNPQWRSAFISNMDSIAKKREQEYLITTHSPFLLSDSRSENVFVFEKSANKIKITQPDIETYGSAVELLLKVAFGVAPPVALKSSKELKSLVTRKNVTIEALEAGINKYGDSIQKFDLYQRIRDFKKEQKKE
ncbi:restriction system-associated AAA family ATPase [Polaribacter sp. HaHaR_3_91]|uniref:restriction system-associated AAA family ATPase n=1 Tax=Polaribacter sp. HaHaR_3_91 TaxID=2745561 RepID=UPI001C4EEFFA|nr:restriction system-associated AAA family ATPase [Polaribacter sp. HaHaR_3_91]QXP63235.1 restriction system-associated AAA family ATPase [Polaribacter sp. HaHaR_3_91]